MNAIDAVRDTPLHVLVSNSDIDDDTIIQLLHDAGAHMDCVNSLGETPIDVVSNSNIQQFLEVRTKISLKCLCARLIRKSDVPFRGIIPTYLIKFVEKH